MVRNQHSGNSYPADLTRVGHTLFFYAQNDRHGRELWRSNGTARGTEIVRDIVPGPGSSYPSNLVMRG
jgi:ELWxxDGT repeat protein